MPTIRRSHLIVVVAATSLIVLIQAPAAYFDHAEPLLIDAVELGDLPTWHGLLSALGIVAWFSAGACAWLASTSPTAGSRQKRAIRSVGTASFLLGIDDLVRFHEVASDYVGLPEAAIFAVYLPVIVWLIVRGLRELQPEAFLLGLAALGFGLSLGMDVIIEEAFGWYFRWEVLLEENAKLFGIASWTGALVLASVRTVRGVSDPTEAGGTV